MKSIDMKLKPKTRSQLANDLGISRATFYRWLKRKNIKIPKGLIMPNTQREIIKKFSQIDFKVNNSETK